MKNWLSNNIVEKEIDGHIVKFRRIPVGTIQKFRVVGEEVSKALALLFKDTEHDIETEELRTPSEHVDDDGQPYLSTGFKQQAAHPSVLSMRATQLEEGIKGIVAALTKDDSLDVLSEVIVKSAWEEFNDADIPNIKDQMDLVTMVEFLKGALEASAGDYAKLGKSWFQNNPTAKVVLAGLVPEEAPMETPAE